MEQNTIGYYLLPQTAVTQLSQKDIDTCTTYPDELIESDPPLFDNHTKSLQSDIAASDNFVTEKTYIELEPYTNDFDSLCLNQEESTNDNSNSRPDFLKFGCTVTTRGKGTTHTIDKSPIVDLLLSDSESPKSKRSTLMAGHDNTIAPKYINEKKKRGRKPHTETKTHEVRSCDM